MKDCSLILSLCESVSFSIHLSRSISVPNVHFRIIDPNTYFAKRQDLNCCFPW